MNPNLYIALQALTPQCAMIAHQLIEGKSITQRSALMDFGVMALPRRIADLKERGWEIGRKVESNKHTGQRFARYFLKQLPTAESTEQ